jgi:hypothetical protein
MESKNLGCKIYIYIHGADDNKPYVLTAVRKSINSKPQPCAMPPFLISPSGEQHRTVEEKMDAIANVSFPTKSCRLSRSQTSCNSFKNSHDEQQPDFTVYPKMLKRLLRTTKNCSAQG